jgi:hypothetical protein
MWFINEIRKGPWLGVAFSHRQTVTLDSWNRTELFEMHEYESDGRWIILWLGGGAVN